MPDVVDMNGEEGPGEYSMKSTVYIFQDKDLELTYCLHLSPPEVSDTDGLTIVSQVTYQVLQSIDTIDVNHIATLHFVKRVNDGVETPAMDLMLLPVGTNHQELDARLKDNDEFKSLLDKFVLGCTSPDTKVNLVTLLYDSIMDFRRDPSKTAIVQELQARVNRDLVDDFLSVMSPA